jgi:outer membrane protein OmpA-like peptidoglycan-associated protein
MRPCLSRRTAVARIHPAAIVLLALATSAALFFTVTRPKLQPTESAPAAAEKPVARAVPPVAPAPAAPAPAKVPEKMPEAKEPPAAPPADRFGFARPLDLGREMVRSLAGADFERAGRLAAVADPSQAAQLTELFQKLAREFKVKVGREDQVELLGLVADKTRLALPLSVPGHEKPLHIELDLERDTKTGWKVAALQLPKELAGALPASPVEAPPAEPAPAAGKVPGKAVVKAAPSPRALVRVESHPDALSFASEFVRVLLRHDFSAARRLVDESKVTPQRLAGLCIVFEEGRYEMKPERPLIVTVANPEVAWVIAQVQSPSLGQTTEFGLELQRAGVDQPWQVKGLNLSEILGSFAASASKLGVPYTPIVKNPRGGESLALYFEYDRAELHPRALKQLEIVAGLLKSDTSRKLRIAGHTDAKGTENYNIQLSRARAEAVKRGLASLGVSAGQIVTTGLGTAQPLGPNQKADGSDNPEGRSRNRRAEIFLDF